MRRKLFTGILAALSVILLPLLICGAGRQKTALSEQAEAVSSAAEQVPETFPAAIAEHAPEAEAAPSPSKAQERQVTGIVIHQSTQAGADVAENAGDADIAVTVTVAGAPQTLALDDYLTGVLMGEMPASYTLEALKAQAVAARTYTLRRMEQGGALSDDPTVCQAYIPASQAEEKWGDQAKTYLEKLRQAVTETDGQVLTYDGQLIAATYFSCSGGKTESAQAVWGGEIPYLVSVDSPGEEDASSFSSTVTVDKAEFMETLGIESVGVSSVTYTDGGGVDAMIIGGKEVTGVEMRKLFGLKSTRFSMEITGDSVNFSVQGYGHRVGMSQNGARVMAEAGSDYTEILKWYYTGVELETR